MNMESMLRYTLFEIFGRPVTAYAVCIAAAFGLGLFLLFMAQKSGG